MRLHLVDGTFELFRAHYSKLPAPDATRATVGLARSLSWLFRDPEERATHVAVAFDNPIRSFRNDLFDGYKTDEGVDPTLRAQFDVAEEVARALGVVVWSMDRFEADDALATAAARWQGDARVEQVRIMTPDKDLGQCVRGTHVVLVDRIRKRTIDEAALLAARGITPASVADFLALVGDSADGYPGVPGFGEKTAAALLRAFEHLEAIPDDATTWPAGVRGAARLAATLREMRSAALLYKKLATLVFDVPLTESLEDLEWRRADTAALARLSERLGEELRAP